MLLDFLQYSHQRVAPGWERNAKSGLQLFLESRELWGRRAGAGYSELGIGVITGVARLLKSAAHFVYQPAGAG